MFSEFKAVVRRQFDKMKDSKLFRVDVSGDELWNVYLKSFPEGTNPMFRTRTEHDCTCCKNFIRNMGNVVAIVDGSLVTIWDGEIDIFAYKMISDTLGYRVRHAKVIEPFFHFEGQAGVSQTLSGGITGPVETWEHFHLELPNRFVLKDSGPALSDARSTHDVLLRALREIDIDSVEAVIELMDQGSLYRGEEFKPAVVAFQSLKIGFDAITKDDPIAQDTFVWSKIHLGPSLTRIRGTVIGTLLVDLAEGKNLNDAVTAYEAKVAPANYKRPTALVTPAMVAKAKETIEGLGLLPALDRRYAKMGDLTINNLLFASQIPSRWNKDVFDNVANKPAKPRNLDKIEEVSIDDFVTNILPKAVTLEVMFENKHANNLVSLIAPCDSTAKGMFKWPNGFSWSYTGDFADSIKERVKKAGGNVTGDLRCSLSWFNYDDLDLHMVEAGGYHLCFSNRRDESPNGGCLDVDMNVTATTRMPVENISYENRGTMKEGTYRLYVNSYTKRESVDVGFEVEIEFDGIIHTFSYPNAVAHGANVVVATIEYTKKGGFKVLEYIPSTQAVKEVWGIKTGSFHKVKAVMLSPNYWDGRGIGNKHFFFMLDGCKNAGTARGFYNEFLSSELEPHRKVLEIIGSKLKTAESDNQLSGLGFSSTQRNYILCKVQGAITREIKVTF